MAGRHDPRRSGILGGASRPSPARVILTAAAVGGVTGIRTMAGPAILARGIERPSRLERLLLPEHRGPVERAIASAVADRVLPALAAGEMVADKLPWVPARTDPLPLLGRATVGAAMGGLVGRRAGVGALFPALAGAAAAVLVASLATRLRTHAEETGVSSTALGFVEDGVVLAAGAVLARTVASFRP